MSSFSFNSNPKYMDFKMNQTIKPIFFTTKELSSFFNIMDEGKENLENKSLFSDETLESEEDKAYRQDNHNSPLLNKTFFNNFDLSKNGNINVKSFLFNFS